MILIINIGTEISQINQNIYKYTINLDILLLAAPYFAIGSPSYTHLFITYRCAVIIDVAIKTTSTSKKITKEWKTEIFY